MTEKDQTQKIQEESASEGQSATMPGRKQSVPASTLKSAPAQLPARKTVQVNYHSDPPSHTHAESPEEPPKQVPVVPPGDYEEDADESPPVQFDDPETDTPDKEAEPPVDEATAAT